MDLEYLEWDSGFFNKKIYRLNIDIGLNEQDLNDLEILDADLIYIHVVEPTPEILAICERKLRAVLYDQKVTYKKHLSQGGGYLDNQYTANFVSVESINDRIEDMAYQSGIYSRFKLDPRLTYKFEELYFTWISKSINRELADEVITANSINNNEEMGFLTLSKAGNCGKIGLIAVDYKFRGNRIGSQLLNKADEWFLEMSIDHCKVVTQLDNLPACSLYEKAGYYKEKIEFIYHYWKN